MKLKLTSEDPNLNRICVPDTGEDSEPHRTARASAREISSDAAIKGFVLDVASQKQEDRMSKEAEVAFEDNVDLIPGEATTTGWACEGVV